MYLAYYNFVQTECLAVKGGDAVVFNASVVFDIPGCVPAPLEHMLLWPDLTHVFSHGGELWTCRA